MALMIYGATGYTGRIACTNAKTDLGLDFIVAGRSEQDVKELAESLNVTCRAFDLTNAATIDSSLDGISVLLNCSGPYKYTAEPLIQACIRNSVHYLDIAAELDSYKLSQNLEKEAQAAGVMLLPGCGSSVAMLGCLTRYALRRVKDPIKIDVALHIVGAISRGTATSAAESVTVDVLRRANGKLEKQDRDKMAFDFDDGNGKVDCMAVTMPDLITVHKSTNVENIETFVLITGDEFTAGEAAGPTVEHRQANPYQAAVCVTDHDGHTNKAVIHMPNGYTFTALGAVKAARRVLDGEVKAGFQVPAVLFGTHFAETIAGSTMKDVAADV